MYCLYYELWQVRWKQFDALLSYNLVVTLLSNNKGKCIKRLHGKGLVTEEHIATHAIFSYINTMNIITTNEVFFEYGAGYNYAN